MQSKKERMEMIADECLQSLWEGSIFTKKELQDFSKLVDEAIQKKFKSKKISK